MFGVARLRLAVEEHGGGRQLARYRSWPKYSRLGVAFSSGFGVLAIAAAFSDASIAAVILGVTAVALVFSAVWDCAIASGVLLRAVRRQSDLADRELERARAADGTGEWAPARTIPVINSSNGHPVRSTSLNGAEPDRESATLDDLPSGPLRSSSKHE
jgi:amino acid transporter